MAVQKVRRTLLLVSALLFPLTFLYLSPVMALGGSYYGLVSGGLAFWALVLLRAPLLGRAFCSYLCPLGGIQMGLTHTVDRPLVRLRFLAAAKWLIWGAWVGGIGYLAWQAGGYSRVDLMWENPGFPPYAREAHLFWLLFTLLPVALVLLLGRRSFCHYLCFFSPLTVVGDWVGRRLGLPGLRIRVVNPEGCVTCLKCEKGCPMSLPVSAMAKAGAIDHRECITCGSCAATCGTRILHYGFTAPAAPPERGASSPPGPAPG